MGQELYEYIHFKDCNLSDPFFDSLKKDYGESDFEKWFTKKSETGEKVYVSKDDSGRIRAFLYIKEDECEEIGSLPAIDRMKIGTLKVDPDFEGRRLGEGAIGIALWKWQQSPHDQIYVTIFPEHDDLIKMLTKFGFVMETTNERGESVFVKDKRKLQYDDWGFSSFPYIKPDFKGGKYLPIEAEYHDQMFPYSILNDTDQGSYYTPVSNGIVKNYIATPRDNIVYRPGYVVLIYRKSPDDPGYKSVITSFCTIAYTKWVRHDCKAILSYDDFVSAVGNKTVYPDEKLKMIYRRRNVMIIGLVYNGYLGPDSHVNHSWLKSSGLFEDHPYKINLTHDDVLKILKEGGKDEHDFTVN